MYKLCVCCGGGRTMCAQAEFAKQMYAFEIICGLVGEVANFAAMVDLID